MINVANTQKSTVQLILMTMLTAALLTAGAAAAALGGDHPAFAHKKGYKGLNSKGISQPTAVNQDAECEVDGAAVRIDVSVSNTAAITSTNNGGLVGGISRP